MAEPTLSYGLEVDAQAQLCRVVLRGAINIDDARRVLDLLWSEPDYIEHGAAVWDISACELPDFYTLRHVAEYVRKSKENRGPTTVAFVSPDFETSTLAWAFRGFERLVHLKMNFFADEAAALAWLHARTAASD